jgi:hypothetical protein
MDQLDHPCAQDAGDNANAYDFQYGHTKQESKEQKTRKERNQKRT